MRLIAGVFLVVVGASFLLELNAFEHWALRLPILIIGPAAIALGGYVLVGRWRR